MALCEVKFHIFGQHLPLVLLLTLIECNGSDCEKNVPGK